MYFDPPNLKCWLRACSSMNSPTAAYSLITHHTYATSQELEAEEAEDTERHRRYWA